MGITVANLDASIKGLSKSNAELTKALAQTLQEAVPPSSEGEMHARASAAGRMQAQAAGTVDVGKLVDGVQARGGGLPYFLGAEFGGRRRPKSRHVVSSRSGRSYVVYKRTTMQFAPFVGHTGYFVTPVWRARLQGIRDKLLKRLGDEVSGA